MIKTIVGVLCCFQSLLALSQDCPFEFQGKIVDFHNGLPLENAQIRVAGSEKVYLSDINGIFVLKNLCQGILELRISHPDCQDLNFSFLVEGNAVQTIYLEHHLEELEAVSIVSESTPSLTKTSIETTIKTDEIEKYSSVSLGDALQQISGVNSLRSGNNVVKPVIQGLHSTRVLMLNHGVRMQDQEWGTEHAPNIDLNAAGNITVVKGASALQYGGDAIGGAVIVHPQKIPVKDSLYGKTILSGSTNGKGGAITSSLTKSYQNGWFANLQGTFKKFGDYQAPDYVLSNTGNEEKDVAFRFGKSQFSSGFEVFYSYYDTKIGVLSASHIGNVSDLVRAINSREPNVINDFTYAIGLPRQEVQHHLVRAKYHQRFESLGKWNIQYDYQNNKRLEYDKRVGEDRNRPSIDLTLQTHSLSSNFLFDAKSNRKFNLGFDASYQVNFPDPATEVRRLIPDYKQYKLGVFALSEIKLKEDLTAEAGLRYDFTHLDAEKFYLKSRWESQNYDEDFSEIIVQDFGTQYLTNPVFDYHNVSLSGGLRYEFNALELLGNYSLANRAPNPAELFSDGLHHSAAVIEVGDLRFDAETSHKLSLALAKNQGDFNVSISPYYNYINDFLLLQPNGTETTTRGSFPVWEYQQTNARLFGVDVDYSYDFSEKFRYSGNFAYVNGKDVKNNQPLILMPPANWVNRISFSKPDWHQLTTSLSGEYVFEQTRFPDNNFEEEIIENGEYMSTLVDISSPPDDYFLLNFETKATFHPFNRGSMQVGFYVQNILNTSYRDYLNRLRYYADNLGRNFQLQIKFNY